MMHPDAELRYIGESIGYGLFARRKIARGTITWAGDELDQRFTETQLAEMSADCREQVRRFAYVDGNGVSVLCWDHGRFVNHSCNPNCLSAGFDFEFAIRDIEAGEQICDDYGLMNLVAPLDCACGAAACRGNIGVGNAGRLTDEWDALTRSAFPAIALVNQPLWPLVAEKPRIEAVLRGEVPTPSCRTHLFRE